MDFCGAVGAANNCAPNPAEGNDARPSGAAAGGTGDVGLASDADIGALPPEAVGNGPDTLRLPNTTNSLRDYAFFRNFWMKGLSRLDFDFFVSDRPVIN